MVGDPYDTEDDPACFPGTRVLKNIPGLHDQDRLDAYEMEMFVLRSEESFPERPLSPAYYCDLHRHLFQDVYPWAGTYRTIRTGKGGNWFCHPEYIEPQMGQLFQRLDGAAFQSGASAEAFIPALAEFIANLNAIHPFREGNGRTQLILARQLGQQTGNSIRIEAVEPDEFLAAMIASFNGRNEALVDELERMLA